MTSPVTQGGEVAAVRYHELDALRAFAMLLGIAFHVFAIANNLPETEGGAANVGVRWFTDTSHAFRMPVFFLMAGFFAALVLSRSGPRAFGSGRAKRIGIPLVVGAIVLVPLMNLISHWAHETEGLDPGPLTLRELTEGSHHLWFLEYLLLYYACALLLGAVAGGAREAAGRALRLLVTSRVRLVVLVAVTAALIYPTKLWTAEVPLDFGVHLEPFAYYGMFFAFGWLLYGQRDLMPELRRHRWPHTLAALAASVAVVVLIELIPDATANLRPWKVGVVLSTAVLTWCAIFALFGWFHRWFDSPNPRTRYVADSAYWLYLAHLPLVAFGYFALRDLGVPLLIRLTVLPVVVTALLLVIYDRWIRYGAVGRVLHGPRRRLSAGGAV